MLKKLEDLEQNLPQLITKLERKDNATLPNGQLLLYPHDKSLLRVVSHYENEWGVRYKVEQLVDFENQTWEPRDREDLHHNSIWEYYLLVNSDILKVGYKLFEHFQEHGQLPEEYQNGEVAENQQETGLVDTNSKENYELMHSDLVEKREQVEAVKMLVQVKMEIAKRQLEAIRHKMEREIVAFQKKIKRIFRVISTIELYLGIKEDLFQIQEGAAAPAGTPITFRQQVLFMDEEVAVCEGGGLDAFDVDKFENWLITNNNYKKLVPEPRCLVVFKPRRFRKEYGDRFTNAEMEKHNKRTYFLMRNGENLYRIDSDNIRVHSRLFPRRTELQTMLQEVEQAEYKSSEEAAKEKFEDTFDQYRRMAFLMQGLIDRTEVFHPMPERVSIFNMEANPDAVNFIYDDDNLLPTGRLPFWEWHKQINSTIKRGSRVLLTGSFGDKPGEYVSKKDFGNRYYRYYSSDWNMPSLPNKGVYEVNEKQHWKYGDALCIKYNPGGEVYNGWGDYDGHERKNNISFLIRPDDSFVLHYDQVSIDDIEFYLNSRVDRPNYYLMMPLLQSIKARLLEEQAQENEFVKLLVGRVQQRQPKSTPEKCEAFARELIDWWKNRTLQKRPISKDDTLAMRMIERRLLAKRNTAKI